MLRPSTETDASVNKKTMAIIIALSSVLVALFVAVVILSIKASSNEEEEDQIAEYKIKKEAVQLEYEKSNSQIQRLDSNITLLQYNLSQLAAQVSQLQTSIATTNSLTSAAKSSDTKYMIISGVCITASAGLNVATGIDAYKQYSTVTSLKANQSELTDTLSALLTPIHLTTYHYISYMLYKKSGINLNKRLLYDTDDDGFNYTTLRSAMCDSSRRSSLVVIITTSVNYHFGLYTRRSWPCSSTWTTDPSAMTFSLDNVANAKSKTDALVIKDDPSYFLNLGDGEITIGVNGIGTVLPGHSFNIPSGYNPSTFYVPETTFKATNVQILYTTVTAGLDEGSPISD